MRLNKIFYIILVIFAFICFLICPSIQELGDNTKHDVVLKVRAKILRKNLTNGFSFTPFKLSNNSLAVDYDQFTTKQYFSIFSSSNPTLNLSILSTIRLIL
jgi:hypothetical protein